MVGEKENILAKKIRDVNVVSAIIPDPAAVLPNPLPIPFKLDLGCGMAKQLGFIGVDRIAFDGVDVIHDLEIFPWPFKDESVDEVFCSHYIEHTPDMIKFMDEMYRILKVGGKAQITAPYYANMRCWQDPTHKRAISEASSIYRKLYALKEEI